MSATLSPPRKKRYTVQVFDANDGTRWEDVMAEDSWEAIRIAHERILVDMWDDAGALYRAIQGRVLNGGLGMAEAAELTLRHVHLSDSQLMGEVVS